MSMKLMPIAVAAVAGMVVGFLACRGTFPSGIVGVKREAESTRNSFAEGVGGESVAPIVGGQTPPAPSGDVRALTFKMLLSELNKLESGNPTGAAALRARADLLERLKYSDLAALISTLAGSPVADRNQNLELVFSAYAEENPQAAWNLALSIEDASRQRSALEIMMATLGRTDPEKALAMAEEIEGTSLRRQLRNIALGNLALTHPEQALGLAMQSSDDWEFGIVSIFAQWMHKDSQAAMMAAASLTGNQADLAHSGIVYELLRANPSAAWDYATGLLQPSRADPRMRMRVIKEWAESDPANALAAALTIQEAENRDQAVAAGVNTWASSDFPAALDYALNIPDAEMRGHILQILARNENANRSQMFGVLMEHAPAGDIFRKSMTNLLIPWVFENPREAANATMQLPPGEFFAHIASRVAGEWASNSADKMEVFEWVRRLPEGGTRTKAVNTLFEVWAKEDPTGSLRALSSLGSNERPDALEGIVSGWSRTAPAGAAAWAASLSSAADRNIAMRVVVRSSPAEAAPFVEKIPETEQAEVMERLVHAWASRDSSSAADWLQRQPAGKSKDAGLKELAQLIALEDHASALSWVNSISDPEMRTGQQESITRTWLRHDPASAKKWIGNSSLPPEVRQRLLQ